MKSEFHASPAEPVMCAEPANASRQSAGRFPAWLWPLVVVLACLVAYSNSLRVPLLLDDEVTIRDNPSIRDLAHIRQVLWPAHHIFSSGRPLLNLSFALNYAVNGTAVEGYHVVNTGIHLFSVVVLFGLLRRTLRNPAIPPVLQRSADTCAGLSSAVWALHPLATNSVTYLSQRAEALAGLFVLLTLYAFARSLECGERQALRWRILAVCACWLGVGVKETAMTAPILVLLLDVALASHSIGTALRRRRAFYGALATSWIVLAVLMAASGVGARGIGFSANFDVLRYAQLEARVVFDYARLAFWPQAVVFDYGWDPFPPGVATWPIFAVLGVVLIAVGVLFVRHPAAGLLPAAFFVLLAPTSSIVPIVAQPMAESRTYLAVATLVTGGVISLIWIGGRFAVLSLLVAAISLGILTHRRNADYRSALGIWSDTVAKVPQSARAHNNLGLALLAEGNRRVEAAAQFRQALRIRPEFPEAEYNLASTFQQTGQVAQAIEHYNAALRLKPTYSSAHNNVGFLLLSVPGERASALAHFRAALATVPGNVEARYNLANALADDPATRSEAIAHYREVIAAKPAAPEPHNNLAIALAQAGDLRAAINELEVALRLNPRYDEARNNLAIVRAAAGQR